MKPSPHLLEEKADRLWHSFAAQASEAQTEKKSAIFWETYAVLIEKAKTTQQKQEVKNKPANAKSTRLVSLAPPINHQNSASPITFALVIIFTLGVLYQWFTPVPLHKNVSADVITQVDIPQDTTATTSTSVIYYKEEGDELPKHKVEGK
jgi:hypothetical protein